MKHYVLTGGIGSGKSTVLKLFNELGVPNFTADDSAKKAMEQDASIQQRIVEIFGEASYIKGKLNSSFIAQKVFGNQEKLQQLNAVVHPAARAAYLNWQQKQNAPYTIYEFPIVFELGEQDRFDGVILVVSSESLRIQRVKKRDNISDDAIRKRMMHQWTDEQKQPLADMVIYNDIMDETVSQVNKLHLRLMHT